MMVGMTRHYPLVVVLEDAQWADVESLAWVDHLLARAAVGSRSSCSRRLGPSLWREDSGALRGARSRRIELRPLSRKQARSIAASILGERASGDQGEALVDSIAQQSAGLPLFAEELARIAAAGRDASDAPTIEAAMQVHLDALDDFGRDAAAKLAVFGHVGWDVGLEALGVPNAGRGAARARGGRDPRRAGALRDLPGTREFAFKHSLMREVAYASLGEESLKDCHARAGRWLARSGKTTRSSLATSSSAARAWPRRAISRRRRDARSPHTRSPRR